MRYIVIILALFLGACNQEYGNASDLKKLDEVLSGSCNAWNSGNLESYMSYYYNDSSTQFISKRGRTMGWQQTLSMYRKSYPNKETMGQLVFETDTIRILSESERMGQITGRWKLYRKTDTPSGFFSLITREFDGTPKIIIDHTW